MGKLRGTDQYSTQTRKMKLQQVFLCLCAVIATVWSEEATALNPRGTRPVEHGYKPDKCASEKQWPFCIDDQWGKKCPSGCRIQGLLDKADHELQSRIEKIRHILGQGQGDYRTANQQSKQTYSYLREQLNLGAGQDSSYLSVADQLRQRITEMKIKIDRQLKLLDALKNEVKKQVIAMQRLEVDIDIKLRSCKGSCSSYQAFSVDKDSFAALDKQLDHLDSLAVQSVETVSSLRVMKSRPLKEELVSSVYKSGLTGGERAEQKLDLFGDVKQVEFSLEAEGSTAESAATVSKVTLGTGSATSPSTTTHVSTHTVSCTKTVRKITEMTKDGPVERQRIEYSGGPGCDRLKTLSVDDHTLLTAAKEGKDLSVGGYNVRVTSSSTDGTDETKSITTLSRGDGGFDGLGGFHDDFFKDLGGSSSKMSTSSSSSSSSTFSSHSSKSSGSSKGTLSDSKTTFFGGPLLGDDLGGFLHGEVEEDLPDIHARSVKTSRTERRSGYVGGACEALIQDHSINRFNLHRNNRRTRQCPVISQYPLCVDDDWGSKCPSGCRLQGFIDAQHANSLMRLRKICARTQQYISETTSNMLTTAKVYKAHRKIIVQTHVSELRYVDVAEALHRNLTLLRKRSGELSQKLKELQHLILEQIKEMHRTEVDIDIKIRACQGSCKSTSVYSIDHQYYKSMRDSLAELGQTAEKKRTVFKDTKLQLHPVPAPPVSLSYRMIPIVRKELLTKFEDIEQNQVVLEDIWEDLLNE